MVNGIRRSSLGTTLAAGLGLSLWWMTGCGGSTEPAGSVATVHELSEHGDQVDLRCDHRRRRLLLGAQPLRRARQQLDDGQTHPGGRCRRAHLRVGRRRESTPAGVTTGSAAYCWGNNSAGALGNNSTKDSHTPVAVAGGLTFAAVSAGTTCRSDHFSGAAYCWGLNDDGQLGNNSDTTTHIPGSRRRRGLHGGERPATPPPHLRCSHQRRHGQRQRRLRRRLDDLNASSV